MILDGYFGQNVNESSKGWNLVLFILLSISGFLLVISGLKELQNMAPLKYVKIIWFFAILISLFEAFVSIFRLIEAANRNTYDVAGAFFIVVLIVLLRECWIKKIYTNRLKTNCNDKSE